MKWLMQVLMLALASHSAFAIVVRGHDKTISFSKFTGSHLTQLGTPLHHASSAILLRPNAGKGADKIEFGMRAMNFYGADLKHHTFSLDMVMTIKWNDTRVVSLIPKDLDKLSMSHKQAEKVMWMPGIVVSNRDIEKYEIIAASVTIYRSGEVRRVERANTRVMKKFMLAAYPFDTQELDINLASSKYMADDVVLVPNNEASGVYEDIWGLYTLHNWTTASYTKYDGELVKSRGALQINVKRGLEKYGQDHLLPAGIVLMISWAVFYFPFANPFITARLALSILALLTFTNLIVKSSKELPGSAPFNYNDLFNQQIQTLMFVTIVLNVTSEISFHSFHKESLARGLNHEAKVLMPFMSILNIILILGGGKYQWFTIEHATILVQVVLVVLLFIYVAYAVYAHRAREAKESKDLEDISKMSVANQCALAAAMALDEGNLMSPTSMDGDADGDAGADC